MSRGRDVVVVGAGVMGSATAWALARKGIDVLALEQFAAGHDHGSSHGASRIFRLAYEDPLYAGFAHTALDGWRALEEEAGESLLTRTGGIDHGNREPLDRIAGALSSHSVPFEVLPVSDAAARWPGLRIESDVLYQADAGVIHADAAVTALQRCAAARGAEFRFREPVVRLEPREDSVVVLTDREEVPAAVVVLTAGAWLPGLAGDSLALPPLRITQEQPAYFAVRDGDIAWPVFVHRFEPSAGRPLEDIAAYGLPTPGHGVKVGEHGTGPVVDPDRRQEPDPAGVARVSRYVEQWLPGLDPEPTSVMSCLYTTTTDDHFVVGRTGRLVVGSPCSGHGFKFAPAMGELLAKLALGRGDVPAPWATIQPFDA